MTKPPIPIARTQHRFAMASARFSLLTVSLLSGFSLVHSLPSPQVAQRAEDVPVTHLGCYVDNSQGSRELNSASTTSPSMTAQVCAAFCSRYQFFGIEYGQECYCGDTNAAPAAPSADCSFPCPGDASETCGAGNRLDVYKNEAYAPAGPAALQGSSYVGCFVDGGPRVLPSSSIASDDMTAAKCQANCAGFEYFGVEYGRECYCGNDAPTQTAPETDCSFPCAGSDAEFCGAGNRLNVYKRTAASSPTTPSSTSPTASPAAAAASFVYRGCYSDSGNARSLAGRASYDDAMTVEKCAAACASYSLFGVEYGSQCFCGTELATASEARPEAECAMPCGGDATTLCGDTNRLSVYARPTSAEAVVSSKETVGGFSYQSCWSDSVGERSLADKTTASNTMTLETCATFCEGFTYFGVEYSTECFCGNAIRGTAAPESECTELCAGDATEWCGGPNRLNVYTTAATTTDPTPADVPTPTASPAAEMTTVTSCPPLPTCYLDMPGSCTDEYSGLGDNYMAKYDCRMGFAGQDNMVPDAVSACLNLEDDRYTLKQARDCLAAAPVWCGAEQRTDCVTKTYPIDEVPAPTPAATGSVPFANGDFETGDRSPWASWEWSQPNVFWDAIGSGAGARSGKYGLQVAYFNTNGDRDELIQNSVAVEPGATYTLSYWVRQTNNQAYCTSSAHVSPVKGDWGSWYANTQLGLRGAAQGEWMEVSVAFTASASFTSLEIITSCNVGSPNTMYIDDITLVKA